MNFFRPAGLDREDWRRDGLLHRFHTTFSIPCSVFKLLTGYFFAA